MSSVFQRMFDTGCHSPQWLQSPSFFGGRHVAHEEGPHMITRREFSLAMGVAAVAATSAAACSSTPPPAPPTSAGRTSFPALKQVDAGLLNVGYAEDGPTDGPPVILLHGWPYDIYSYVDVAPVLAAKGYRVIVPYLRGFGTTHFLSDKTFRNGQQAALAADIVAFMDALKIPQAVIGGFDWGARTACVIAALWPQRCKALVSVSGYLIVNLASSLKPLAPQAELGWWYQYDAVDRQLAGMPPITVPAITIASDFDGPAKDGSAYRQLFTGRYDHRVLDGIGHDVPQAAPQEFANAIFDVAKY